MTAQPTTRIPTPPYVPQGPVPHGAFPQGPFPQNAIPQGAIPQGPSYGPPQPQSFGPAYPPPFPPAPPATPRRNTGKIVGLVAVALVLLGGLGAGALYLFGQRTVEPESVQREIVRITETAVKVTPADVRCPAEIKAQAGGTFTCTATVEGQPVTYTVRQTDDQGNLTITYDRLIKLAQLESTLADQVGKDVDVAVTVTCEPAGRTVLVNAPGTPIACTAANATDPTDSAKINVTVPADGAPTYTFA
jgi:Domain of unknown function (DUF4333)